MLDVEVLTLFTALQIKGNATTFKLGSYNLQIH